MEKYYQWKYLSPSKYNPTQIDPLYATPRIIQPKEMKECKYHSVFSSLKGEGEENGEIIKWKTYKQFKNGDIIFELDADQRTPPWFLGRAGRITSSKGAECMGLSPYNKDLVTTGLEIAGYFEKQRTEQELKIMNNGIVREPYAKLHCETYYKCEIQNRGLLVPSWRPFLGDSPDGETVIEIEGEKYRASVEFKCPVRLYRGLEERLEVIEEGGDVSDDDFTHIKPDHFIQCYFHMYCMNTKFCIYHVCDFEEETFFSQIIPFEPKFWAWCLQRLDIFEQYYLRPILRNTPYPILPSFRSK